MLIRWGNNYQLSHNDPRDSSEAMGVESHLCKGPVHYNYLDSKVHGANMGPPGADRPQVGPTLAPRTLLSRYTLEDSMIVLELR